MRLRRHAVLKPLVADEVLVSVGVGPRGEAYAVWASPQAHDALSGRITNRGGASFAVTRTDEPVPARVTVHDPDLVDAIAVAELSLAHLFVQPLPHGQILLVGARCRWHPDEPEHNAVIVDAQGAAVSTATVGDGVQHVMTTASGAVWTAYSDEGVYGNYGWGVPGPAPIGRPGLLKWTPDLRPDWRYPIESDLGRISDCYAMNLDGEDAWVCYYTDFPLVRVDGPGHLSGWRTGIFGVSAFVVADAQVAFVGGDRDDDRVVVADLVGQELVVNRTERIVWPSGHHTRRAEVFARGAELHVFSDTHWFRADLGDP